MGALAAVHSGAAVVLPSPGFSPPHALETISKEKYALLLAKLVNFKKFNNL